MIKIGNTEITSIPGLDKVYLGGDIVFGGNIFPPGYTRLQYIECAGASALNTGIVVAETDKIILEEEITSPSAGGDKFMLSCQAGFTGGGLWVETYGSANKWYVRFGNSSSASYDSTAAQISGRHTIRLRKNSFDFDGSQFLVLGYSSMPDTPLCFGGRITSDGNDLQFGFYGYLYDAKIQDSDGNLRWHGIPAKETNGTGVGMYDVVSGQFFASVSSTPFTAGPDYE